MVRIDTTVLGLKTEPVRNTIRNRRKNNRIQEDILVRDIVQFGRQADSSTFGMKGMSLSFRHMNFSLKMAEAMNFSDTPVL